MFLADSGNIALTVQHDRFTTLSWADIGVDSFVLAAVAPEDFEVVEFGPPVPYDNSTDCVRN